MMSEPSDKFKISSRPIGLATAKSLCPEQDSNLHGLAARGFLRAGQAAHHRRA